MSSQLSIAVPTQFPLGEVLPPQPESVQEYHAELVTAARQLRKNLMRIAYYGFRMRLKDGWTDYGFEPGPRGEDAYRESLGIPRSTYYKYVRIGQYLHQLQLADLEHIPVSNAELLIQVNPELMHDHPWITEAKLLAPAKFAELIVQRNRASGDTREPLQSMVFKVPYLAKKSMEDMLEAIQRKHELSSKGQALEFMIADLHNDPNLISATHQALQILDGVVKSRKRRKAPEDEEAAWLDAAIGVLHEAYEKAVQTARQKTYRGSTEIGGRS